MDWEYPRLISSISMGYSLFRLKGQGFCNRFDLPFDSRQRVFIQYTLSPPRVCLLPSPEYQSGDSSYIRHLPEVQALDCVVCSQMFSSFFNNANVLRYCLMQQAVFFLLLMRTSLSRDDEKTERHMIPADLLLLLLPMFLWWFDVLGLWNDQFDIGILIHKS